MKLYKIVSCTKNIIELQLNNKATIFTISWDELFLRDYLCNIPKEQLFFLGTYYMHNMRNINLKSKLSKDPEILEIQKMILTEIRGGNYILLDLKTEKLETLSLKFLLKNIQLLESFTSAQCFFLGVRTGEFYDKSNEQ